MSTTESVIHYLRDEGYPSQLDENGNIIFKAEDCNFIYVDNDEDETFFQLALPAFYEVDESNRETALDAANQCNMELKVVKTCVAGDSVWAMFEVLLDRTPDVEVMMPRAIRMLLQAKKNFYLSLI